MSDKPSGFFSRWNQRRQEVEDERLAEEADSQNLESSVELAETENQQTPAQELQDENQVLTADDLPDPDKIEVGGSFASFMGANVDPTAKAAALKALWKQPQYNEIDGLLEYALDYSNQPKLSAEQSAEIAKKVFRHVTKKEEEVEAEELELAQEVEGHTDGATGENTADNAVASNSNEPNLDSEAAEDILDIKSDDLSQNAPDSNSDTKDAVV
ncbi:DUF3306 domain-containing protein [Shewanella sp. UCD-KL12]|uniref:DUF3306 domain-containing protein n=1 Tax=Shewanella sp. UCD-KL12 TaxID=1917163 RepID=UPI0009703C76|nr:DUF3306 domain-containing protein [Shewanella sp. UCD-KL12]